MTQPIQQQITPYRPPVQTPPGTNQVSFQPLPQQVAHMAQSAQLGALDEVYKPSFTNSALIIAIALAVIIPDLAIFAIVKYGFDYTIYALVAIPCMAVIFALGALYNRSLKVYVFHEGLIRVKGTNAELVRWNQVEAIWLESMKMRYDGSKAYILQYDNGKRLTFAPTVAHLMQLGKTIEQGVTRHLLPLMITTFQQGNTITFGELSVDKAGIHKGNELLSWTNLKSLEITPNGLLLVCQGQQIDWSKIKETDIPNFLIFTGLVNHIIN